MASNDDGDDGDDGDAGDAGDDDDDAKADSYDGQDLLLVDGEGTWHGIKCEVEREVLS